jgi:hypothetical protein
MLLGRPGVNQDPSRVVKEDEMRSIDCPCGHHFEAAGDDELFRLRREHVDQDHPEMQRTDQQLRERIAADAYDIAQVAS